MSRVKTGPLRRRRHKAVLAQARGFRLSRSSHYKVAHESVMHSMKHQYIGRKLRKRDFRRLWIQRITAGLSSIQDGPSYSVFISLLKKHQVELDRKVLAHLALHELESFNAIVAKVYGK